MAKKIKITKEMILDSAFKIAREKGMQEVSNRAIAKELDSSIRPIYYQFSNSDELKEELYKRIESYFYKFLLNNMTDKLPLYKQVGINYIKFAREESNLFKVLFMSKTDYLPDGFVAKNEEGFEKIARIVRMSTNIKYDDIKSFHLKMWIFTHGIASLVVSNSVKFKDEDIERLLSYEFQALMLLEENPDNKWNISKWKGDKNE